MKKGLAVGIILSTITSPLLISSVYAGAMGPVSTGHNWNGLYLGAGGGYQILRNSAGGISGQIGLDTDTVRSTYAFAADTSGNGGVGTIFAGYGMKLGSNFWLGGEFNADWSGITISQHDSGSLVNVAVTTTIDNGVVDFKLNTSLGITARPGYLVSDNTKIYGIIGAQWGQINGTDSVTYNETGTPADYGYVSNTWWATGVRYGVGMETALNQSLTLRGEIDQTNYRNNSIIATTTPGGGTLGGEEIKLASTSAVASLVWTFDGFPA